MSSKSDTPKVKEIKQELRWKAALVTPRKNAMAALLPKREESSTEEQNKTPSSSISNHEYLER